jgi:hypothetical protein
MSSRLSFGPQELAQKASVAALLPVCAIVWVEYRARA